MTAFIVGGILCITLVFAGIFWFFAGMTTDRRKDIERRLEIESGIMKSNAKADNATTDSELDKRVRKKYGSR